MDKLNHNGSRYYKINTGFGEAAYPSVTTILGVINKEFLYDWYGKLGSDKAFAYLQWSAERGDRIHEGFETLLSGYDVLYNPKSNPNFTEEELKQYKKPYYILENSDEILECKKLQEFLKIVKAKTLFTEQAVYSDSLKDAGTLDALVQINSGTFKVNGRTPLELEGGVYLLDLKTGRNISEDYYLQIAAYYNAALERKLVNNIIGGLILHTQSKNKTGIPGFGVHLRTKKEIEEDLEIYKYVRKVWDWKYKKESPTIFTVPTILNI